MSSIEYRVATVADAGAIAGVYAPYVRDTAFTFEIDAPDAAEMAARIVRIADQYPWLLASDDGELIGYAYACENRSRAAYRWSVDVAIYVRATTQRRGVGRALYARLLAILREQGYVNAFAGITLPNGPSVGLHHEMGFILVGAHRKVGYKLGAWHDVGWWQRVMREPPDNPPEPTAFAGLDAARVSRILIDGAVSGASSRAPRRDDMR